MVEVEFISISIAIGLIICAIILIYLGEKCKMNAKKLQRQLNTARQNKLREEKLKETNRESGYTIEDIYFDTVEG